MDKDHTPPPEDSAEVEALEDFLDSLDLLNEAQLLRIHASWRARDNATYDDAWTAVMAAAAKAGLTGEMEQARDAVLSWATRGTNKPWPSGGFAEDSWLQMRRQAGPALADAAVAIVLGDRLDREPALVLLAPWLSARGEASS